MFPQIIFEKTINTILITNLGNFTINSIIEILENISLKSIADVGNNIENNIK